MRKDQETVWMSSKSMFNGNKGMVRGERGVMVKEWSFKIKSLRGSTVVEDDKA